MWIDLQLEDGLLFTRRRLGEFEATLDECVSDKVEFISYFINQQATAA